MIYRILKAAVQRSVKRHEQVKDDQSYRQVVRNGYLLERQVQTGVGGW